MFLCRLAVARKGLADSNRFVFAEEGTVFYKLLINNMDHELAFGMEEVLDLITSQKTNEKYVVYGNLEAMAARPDFQCQVISMLLPVATFTTVFCFS